MMCTFRNRQKRGAATVVRLPLLPPTTRKNRDKHGGIYISYQTLPRGLEGIY